MKDIKTPGSQLSNGCGVYVGKYDIVHTTGVTKDASRYRNIVKRLLYTDYLSKKSTIRQMRQFYEKEEIELFLYGYLHIHLTLMIPKLYRLEVYLLIISFYALFSVYFAMKF